MYALIRQTETQIQKRRDKKNMFRLAAQVRFLTYEAALPLSWGDLQEIEGMVKTEADILTFSQ